MMLGIEFVGGSAIEKIIGECPWKYTGRFSVYNKINLAYLPAWALLGYFSEKSA